MSGRVLHYARTLTVVAGVALALVGCGGVVAPGPVPTNTPPIGEVARITPIADGVPADRVTDVTAVALTDAEFATMQAACEALVGVPVEVTNCVKEQLNINFGDGVPLIPCLTTTPVCVAVGQIEGTDTGVLQVVDQRPDRPACNRPRPSLCAGAVVSQEVVEEVRTYAGGTSTTETTPPTTTEVSPTTSTPPPTSEATTPPDTSPPASEGPSSPTGPGS